MAKNLICLLITWAMFNDSGHGRVASKINKPFFVSGDCFLFLP